MVGLPECKLNLSQTVAYLACAPKSNAATTAIFEAIDDVRSGRILPVPKALRDAHFRGAKELGHVGYQYAHDAPGAVAAQDYLGVEREYYRPTDRGAEKEIGERLEKIRAILKTAKSPEKTANAAAEKSPKPVKSSGPKNVDDAAPF
jgi:putative ATPase